MHFHGMHILFVLPFYSNERAIRYVTVHTSERAPAWFPLVCVPVVKESANRIDHVPKLFNKARLPRQATVAGYRGRLPCLRKASSAFRACSVKWTVVDASSHMVRDPLSET